MSARGSRQGDDARDIRRHLLDSTDHLAHQQISGELTGPISGTDEKAREHFARDHIYFVMGGYGDDTGPGLYSHSFARF
jgi:hypothetical protein